MHHVTLVELQAAQRAAFGTRTTRGLAGAVDEIIDLGRINAHDTVFAEQTLPVSEFDYCVRASIVTVLSCDLHDICARHSARPHNVLAWFARRGLPT